jgi:hypothetical protein
MPARAWTPTALNDVHRLRAPTDVHLWLLALDRAMVGATERRMA